MDAQTLPQLLLHNAHRYGHRKVAIREKDLGIWQAYTWAQYLTHVQSFALGLASLGFQRGDRLAIIGDNRPQLYWAMVAAQCLGGIPVPVYQDAIEREVQYVVEHAEARMAVAEDQEQVDKLLHVKAHLPQLETIIYSDPRGMYHYHDPCLRRFTDVQESGTAGERARPDAFTTAVEAGQGEDIAIMVYTSGTTGSPKGVLLSHQSLLTSAHNFLQVEAVRDTDEVMAYLPMAWVGDFYFSVVLSFLTGLAVNCPEGPTTVLRDLREIGPTFFLCPPRIWESLLADVRIRIDETDWLKRTVFNFFMAVGGRVCRRQMQRQSIPLGLRLLRALGEFFVFLPLRDQMGLRRVRLAYTGGAALSPDIFYFFRSLGINYKQVYGLTECAALATYQPDDEVSAETVGKPLPHVRLQIADNGEVLLQSPALFSGYYKNPAATQEALKDGWLHTGDAGFFDKNNHLVIVDRARDVSTLTDGTMFAPQYLENKLKFSPYIQEAVAIGKDRPYVAALINIDLGTVGNWAERQGIGYTSYTALAQKPEVAQLIRSEVEKVNAALASDHEQRLLQIKKFLILHKELDPDDAEITRTRKVRRGFIAEKYVDIIAALYADVEQVKVTTTVTYEDGRQAALASSLVIHDMDTAVRVTA